MACKEPDPAMIKMSNEQLVQMFVSDDNNLVKKAQASLNDYIRTTLREESFFRAILPPLTITADELDPNIADTKPMKIFEKEPNIPSAMTVPFSTLPANRVINGPRFPVYFNRIVTPRFYKDVEELLTYKSDIRQIISDNSIKDMMAVEDSRFISAVDGSIGAVGSTLTDTNAVHNVEISGGITRENIAEAMKTMPRFQTASGGGRGMECECILINNITAKDFLKWGRDEVGGDLAEEMLTGGLTVTQIHGKKLIITNKTDLVSENEMYMFAAPKFLGKNCILTDATMYVDKKAFMVEWFSYETLGCTIFPQACAKVTFT